MRTLLVLIATFVASPALAQGLGVEIRGGAALSGYTAPSQLLSPFTNGRLEDVSVDLIWNPPINPLFLIGSPGVEVGATADFLGGDTLAHANLLWQVWVPLTPIYVEGGLGAAAVASQPVSGCAVMPYATAGVGAQLGDNFTVTVGVDHANDFGLWWRYPHSADDAGRPSRLPLLR
jgi:hypothetical protein